jgi:putative methyltransferase (TIGR04325 family)
MNTKFYKSLVPSMILKKMRQSLLNKVFSQDSAGSSRNASACKYGFFGDFPSWEEAAKQSIGYDSKVILEKVKNAALKVKRGEAVYERDSVLFDKIQYSWALLSGILWVASMNDNRLNLIDFGGSLGTSYYQNRKFLKHLKALTWNIVEQESFVKCGKDYFEDEHLSFHLSIEACIKSGSIPDAILISGVLEYIEKPYELLKRIFDFNIKYILIDRTPFSADGRDCITIQKVTSEIYKGSYPHWFFSLDKFKNYIKDKYELVEEFNSSIDSANFPSIYKGFIFSLKKQ